MSENWISPFASKKGVSRRRIKDEGVVIATPIVRQLFLIMGLTVFYMVNVFRNDRVEKDKKVLWAVVLFMGNMIEASD